MAINWYPGHMHKANKEMLEVLPQVDLIIELLDARLPYSSRNPSIARLCENKPSIKVFSKSDLADPLLTERWQAWFEREALVKTLPTTLKQADKGQKLIQLCQKLVPARADGRQNILAMITGIPNVGKSTLINAMAGHKIAKTGDEPAITKGLQRIKLDNGIMLLDTPGILWPKIHNENSGYRLAASGAIKDTAMDVEEVAFHLCEYLMQYYPGVLIERYGLAELPTTEFEVMELIGARRHCLRSGGQVDLEKVSSILVNELRSGTLGQITLETPEMIAPEEEIVELKRVEKAARDEARKAKRRGSRAKK
jgi:ribosome biogenesis GTPase A